MPDSGRSNLTVNEKGASLNFFGVQDPFANRPWARCRSNIEEEFELTPINTTMAYGNTTPIELDKRGTMFSEMTLQYTRSALTSNGSDQRFPDWEGHQSFDLKIIYNNKEKQTIRGDQLLKDVKKRLTEEERTAEAILSKGYLTDAQRTTSAASSATIRVPLRLPWANMKRMIAAVGLPNKPRFEFTFKSLSDICESSDATSFTCTISDVRLLVKFYHYKLGYQAEQWNKVHSPTGIINKITTKEYHLREEFDGTTATKFTCKIRNIRNDVYQLHADFRIKTDVSQASGTSSGGRKLENYQLPDRVWLADNGTRITKIYYPSIDRSRENVKQHPNIEPGIKYCLIPFCRNELVEGSDTDCFMSRCFAGYNNLEFIAEWDSAPATTLYVDIIGDVHNVDVQKYGDWRVYLV